MSFGYGMVCGWGFLFFVIRTRSGGASIYLLSIVHFGSDAQTFFLKSEGTPLYRAHGHNSTPRKFKTSNVWQLKDVPVLLDEPVTSPRQCVVGDL